MYTPDRLRTHERLIEQYLARQSGVLLEGFAAVVTAGPPGAGKTSRLCEEGYDEEWRRIDPDIFKEMLVADATSDPDLATLLSPDLPDGRPVMPLELAALPP
jgi:hypothetical protein